MSKLFHYLSAAVLSAAILAPSLYSADASALTPAEREERVNAKSKVTSATVGKKVLRAFELYSQEDIAGAIVMLLEIEPSKGYDEAYLKKFIGNLYATQEGKVDLAIKYTKEAVDLDELNYKEQGEAIKLLAQLYMMTKNYQGAIDQYKNWMSFTGEQDAKAYIYIANSYYELKQLDKVVEPANMAIKLHSEPEVNVTPYILKLASYYERKMYPETVKMGETLVKLVPTEKRYWTQLGMFYVLIEDYKRALSTMELAYKQGFLEKENEFKTLAQMYSQLEVPIKAATIQEKYIKAGVIERNESNLQRLANYFLASKELEKAALYFGQAAAINKDADLYRRQGESYFQAEKYSQAVTALNTALSSDVSESKRGGATITLMQAYFYQGKYKEAYETYQQAAKMDSVKRQAGSWKQYIIDKAKFHGVNI